MEMDRPAHFAKHLHHFCSNTKVCPRLWGKEVADPQSQDNSVLFTYAGYQNLADDEAKKSFTYDNEVALCYSECEDLFSKPSYIGLQGSKCFCLDSAQPTTENTAQDRCWGNSQEYCGTTHGMSVYKVEFFQKPFLQWNFNDNGLCGYMMGSKFLWLMVATTQNCQQEKGHICKCNSNNNVCFYENDISWTAANTSCSLAKLTSSNYNRIYKHVDDSEYWIGLHRHRYVGWISGEGIMVIPYANETGCLWVESENGTLFWGVSPCVTEYKYVCNERETGSS
ncbi:uncharacterized protein LOC121385103 [Gigantopelta aegis]|uniref:uncharacterized protein LOC121385103 n=1 Tax=Gigantopelta aegis TaxID=1735272 RepID=UPI001B88B463|nr:uncharacterized protein LOC121385103 [Gigantopelta aegis]